MKYPTAQFQREIYNLLENFDKKFVEILAFRGSAKSSIANLVLPIWATISNKAHFPLLLSDTFNQAKQHIYNLKTELDGNEMLKNDWGPFEGKDEWTAMDVVMPEYGARITSRSSGQRIRGIRHKEYRPDLCVADDLENVESVRTKEARDKHMRWFLGEVLPALDTEAKVVLIGNLLHSDSLMMRIKEQIDGGAMRGEVREYPFFDDKGNPMWKEKFSTPELIEEEMMKYGGRNSRDWQREFLLKIVAEEGQEIKDEWIKHYDELPDDDPFDRGTGVDLAISKKETADYTAMVSGKLYMVDEKPVIYVLPNPVNERISFRETIKKAKDVSLFTGDGDLSTLWVEDVAYQKSAVEEMQREGLPANGVKSSTDKRARLRTIASYVENGSVLFPRKGCEDLIIQLTGFGVEAHDDLCDSFVFMVQGLMSVVAEGPRMTIF
uniref:Putative terminase n=1 Tax=viral metagenome TaxID=1070528 RepID=A0A6M3M7P0_9ZZZZ